MKPCPFCKAPIAPDALKCQHCASALLPLGEPSKDDDPRRVTYVLDRDLIRFLKFAGAVLAVFITVGLLLYGFDLEHAAKEIRDAQDETKKLKDEMTTAKAEVQRLQKETAELNEQAKAKVADISSQGEQVRTIVQSSKLSAESISKFGPERTELLIQSLMRRHLKRALGPDQFALLEQSLAGYQVKHSYSEVEIRDLTTSDIAAARRYFSSMGLSAPEMTVEIQPDLSNAYFDSDHKIIFGMGMVNSEIFGPYEQGVVYHEACHSLFAIEYRGDSLTVSEHICDVLAVVIRGQDWYVGYVRGPDDGVEQYLRRLDAPGTAFNTPAFGKDEEVDHMTNVQPNDGSAFATGPRLNIGILNKAAFLMSQGGTHHGMAVEHPLGRDQLGKLYVEVIKTLGKGDKLSLVQFKDLVVATSNAKLGPDSATTVRQAFAAVGL